jgi:hypothetical protein
LAGICLLTTPVGELEDARNPAPEKFITFNTFTTFNTFINIRSRVRDPRI